MTTVYIVAGIVAVVIFGFLMTKSNKAPQEPIKGNPIVDNPSTPEEPIEAN